MPVPPGMLRRCRGGEKNNGRDCDDEAFHVESPAAEGSARGDASKVEERPECLSAKVSPASGTFVQVGGNSIYRSGGLLS
jgi:hypothetical protein